MWKDPRYTFYCHPKNRKFDITNEDVLHVIKEANFTRRFGTVTSFKIQQINRGQA